MGDYSKLIARFTLREDVPYDTIQLVKEIVEGDWDASQARLAANPNSDPFFTNTRWQCIFGNFTGEDTCFAKFDPATRSVHCVSSVKDYYDLSLQFATWITPFVDLSKPFLLASIGETTHYETTGDPFDSGEAYQNMYVYGWSGIDDPYEGTTLDIPYRRVCGVPRREPARLVTNYDHAVADLTAREDSRFINKVLKKVAKKQKALAKSRRQRSCVLPHRKSMQTTPDRLAQLEARDTDCEEGLWAAYFDPTEDEESCRRHTKPLLAKDTEALRNRDISAPIAQQPAAACK